MAPSRTSRRVRAGAAGTWPGPVISGSGTPTRSPTCPRRVRRPSSTTGMRCSARAARCMSRVPRSEAGGRAGHRYVRAEPPGLVRVLEVMHHVPVERCADILGSMSGTRPSDGWVARSARPRGDSGRGGEQDHPGADHPGPRGLRRRDAYPVRPGPEDQEEVPAGRLHQPAHVLLPRQPGPALVQGLHLQRPARHRDRARPVRQLRPLHRRQPPVVHSAPAQGHRGRASSPTRTPSGPARSQRPCGV